MTKEELVEKLEAYGIHGLAEEVRNSDVSIDDSAHFTVFDKEMEESLGEEGYGNYYSIKTEEIGGEDYTAVYGKLVEPEGGTVWMFRDAEYYDIPEGKDDYDSSDADSKYDRDFLEEWYDEEDRQNDADEKDGISLIDAIEADNQYDRDLFEGRMDDEDSQMDDNDSVDIG